jgi:hypothetical protein
MRSISDYVDMGLEVATSDQGSGGPLAAVGAVLLGAAALGRVSWSWTETVTVPRELGFTNTLGETPDPLVLAAEATGADYEPTHKNFGNPFEAPGWVQFHSTEEVEQFLESIEAFQHEDIGLMNKKWTAATTANKLESVRR